MKKAAPPSQPEKTPMPPPKNPHGKTPHAVPQKNPMEKKPVANSLMEKKTLIEKKPLIEKNPMAKNRQGERRMGVNIDHVATLRNVRGTDYPDPITMIDPLVRGGASSITVHLREDRRHIRDDDVIRLIDQSPLPINLEIAANDTMIDFALRHRPAFCCLVPERREEQTTESGLHLQTIHEKIQPWIAKLRPAPVRVSLFLDPYPDIIRAGAKSGAHAIELHTGAYCNAVSAKTKQAEINRLRKAGALCRELGIECHAGHGLNLDNVDPIAAIPSIREFNIGHSIVARALHIGMEKAVREMRDKIIPS